jgi:hypothetical protein
MGIGDWIGKELIHNLNREFLDFAKARNYARNLNLSSRAEWQRFWKENQRPTDIPAKPDRIYSDKGWKGWSDFLDCENKRFDATKSMAFSEAKNFVKGLNLNSVRDWQNFSSSDKRPNTLTSQPNVFYSKHWKGWADFLGKE